MKIEESIKLDFDDVLIKPMRSNSASRKDVELERDFLFYHSSQIWEGLPVFASNMDSVGTIEMFESLSEYNIPTCLHKHYDEDKLFSYLKDNECRINRNTLFLSIGQSNDDLERLVRLGKFYEKNKISHLFPPNICIDVANGYTNDFVTYVGDVRAYLGIKPIIMAGNVCTPEMVHELIVHGGADIIKIGIGPGSACTTRLVTGVGYPQLSAISECAQVAHGLKTGKGKMGLICADGGCKTPGDVCKAFAANADFVMIGGMFAGTSECDGEWVNKLNPETGKPELYFRFYGMSSYSAQNKYNTGGSYKAAEGKTVMVPCKGPVSKVVKEILGGLRSCCTYVGATCLKDLAKCSSFIKVNNTHNRVFGG